MGADIQVVKGSIQQAKDEAVVVNLFEGVTRPGGATGAVDAALDGTIAQLIALGDFKGKFKETVIVPAGNKLPSPRLLVVGLGKRGDFTLDRVREVAAKAATALRDVGVSSFSTIVHGAGIGGLKPEEAAEATAEGTWLGLYRFEGYKTEKKDEEKKEVKKVTIVEQDGRKVVAFRKAVATAKVIADATNLARDLVSKPANEKTPTALADTAQRLAKEAGLKCTVLDRAAMEKLGMGGVLGVARGSEEPPKFLALEYWGGPKRQKPLVLAGKGITFDSGGINLKPSDGMWPMYEMKEDMSGAAAAICAIYAAAKLRLKVNVVAVAPCTENLPGGRAQKPGDILRTISGKTVEVLNTDAEGRLVLADALGYAQRYEPQAIIDLATLTGAAVIALGKKTSAIMGTSDALMKRIQAAADRVGDRVWPLPLWDEYEEQVKSDIADVKNTGGRGAGAIAGGMFLKKFAGEAPWVHIDIAGTVWTDGGADGIQKAYMPKGATGMGVRLLVRLMRDWKGLAA